jgi:hypothetical protein
VQQALTGNVDMGTATGNAPSSAGVNAGVYTQFNKGNGSGILIRIAANGSTDTGAAYNWPSSGSLVINHGLLRQPIGFHVVDQDKNAPVSRTAPPDNNQITLTTTDPTASHTIYVF